ncbi:acyclic terpene utilization AtuA family protein [Delftia sp. ASV31]|uniref:acyclic terpene utilization AtuA family protein n=1 Tax=Delftia sp. ASV31 TaxID=2795113 RepID=UPI0018EB0BC5|nr:acyclic terpene utilization AtuA family protein [Delftia sp. ASV31]
MNPSTLPDRPAQHTVLIGGASGFWGDSQMAVPQLLQQPDLQYLVFDYLAETTMSILQRARLRSPDLGYATDFVTSAVGPHLRAIRDKGVRLVSNAGGLHPAGCRDAILALAREQGVQVKVAIVTGDDVLDRQRDFEPWQQEPLPAQLPPLMSASAYLGAEPIARALDGGADIVVTGRCVDSAALLGIAIHEFGWRMDDYDRLAQASLAGHLVECGAQATGGLFTDWEAVPDWADIGYPLVRMQADGGFELFQPAGRGGLVTRQTVGEQLLYEIGDPCAYALPDVVCDFSQVRIEDLPGHGGEGGRVRVGGARGRAPGPGYKVTATYQQGWQIAIMMAIRGQRAMDKACRTAEALLARTRVQMHAAGFADYGETLVELLGAESMYGPHRRVADSREIVLRIAARHADRRALGFLQKEASSAGTSMGPGTRSHFGGRSEVQSVIRTASFLLPKAAVAVQWQAAEDALPVPVPVPVTAQGSASTITDEAAAAQVPAAMPAGEDTVRLPLGWIAHGRSGDKGDDANIGLMARAPQWLPVLREQVGAERVQAYFAHLASGPVTRYELPGLGALNFVLRQALGGGGSCSLRSDPLGKCYAQMLLDMEIDCPRALAPHGPPVAARAPGASL